MRFNPIFVAGIVLVCVSTGVLAASVTIKEGSAAAFVLKPARAAVADTTAPVTTIAPAITCAASTTATLSATISEAGTGYYLVQPAATAEPSVASVLAGTSFAMASNISASKTITGLSPSTSYKAYFVAKDVSGNVQSAVTAATPAPFSTSGSSPLTATSVAADDGYVKATSTGASASVGSLGGLYIGRGSDSSAPFNRAILSFDTSGIPDCATITRAYVTVTYSAISGDPWANPAGNSLVIDVKTGTFGVDAMEASDWSTAATVTSVATISKFTSGSRVSTDFNADGLGAINRTGKTQLKLRFSSDQSSTNYIAISSGTATLYVEYTP